MRLLVISQYFWPEDFRINELVSELSARGHEITVLTGKPNYPEGRVFPAFRDDPAAFSRYAKARVIRVPVLPRRQGAVHLLLNYVSFAVSATIMGLMHLRRSTFDATFVFEPSPVTVGIPAVVLRALRGWPVAFWVLDQWPETLEAVGVVRSRRVLALVGSLVRWIYSRCDLMLSPSRLLIPRIAALCRSGQRIEYFPNWAESAYDGGVTAPAPELAVDAASFTVLFAGNIGEAQDFPTILDAAERLKGHSHIRWVVVGDGRMAAWVQGEIERRGLSSRLSMLGRFPANRMPSFFAHADALLVSLKPEPVFALTAPGKIQSYLAAGRPVLAMLDGEGAAVIDEARAGLTSPAGDAGRLAENVLRLAALSGEERAAMAANGRAHAQREFDRHTLVERLERWMTEMSANSATRKDR